MANTTVRTFTPITTALMLGAALGPLAALSLGSKYADEETLERARAGAMNAKSTDLYASYDSTRRLGAASGKTISEITDGAGVFRELQAAVRAAGAEAMLSGSAPITVFAPSNDAFSKLSPQQRASLLTDKEASSKFIAAHVVQGVVSETELLQRQFISTASGAMLPVSTPGLIKVGNATISKSIAAQNGMVHVIDSVLL